MRVSPASNRQLPALPVDLRVAVAEGRAGVRDLGARMVGWRVPWYWYAVAIGLPLLVRFGSVLVNTGAGGAPAPEWTGLAWTSFAMAFLVRLVNRMDGPLGEEPGWRGFAVPRLQAGRSPLATALILGVLVAGWHLPLVLVGDIGPVGLVTTFSITIVYVWLFNRTSGSVLLTLLFHAAQGTPTMADLGLVGAHLDRQEFIECVVWSIVAAGVLVLNRSAWRASSPSPAPAARGPAPRERELTHRY